MHLRTAFTHLILRSFVLHSGFDVAFSVLLLFAFFFGRFSDSFFQPNY